MGDKASEIAIAGPSTGVKRVVAHPLVLLSAVDHYRRQGLGGGGVGGRGRVVGCLLGECSGGRIDCTNSFAIPFAEMSEGVYFMDEDYLTSMYRMFYKVNAKEKIVGFYTTGNSIRANDIHLEALFRRHVHASVPTPAMVVIDVEQRAKGGTLPLKGYVTAEITRDGRETRREFQHVATDVEAYPAEEVGVEHLLRDVNDPTTIHSLTAMIKHRLIALGALRTRLQRMATYLGKVSAKDASLPPNHDINALIQRAVNLIANLSVERLTKALAVKTNDYHVVLYVSALVRSVLSLHDLLSNRLRMREHAAEEEKAEREEKEKKVKEKKEKENEKTKSKGKDAKKGRGAKGTDEDKAGAETKGEG